MNEKTASPVLYPILGALSGMILGFATFLLTEQIIFLIAFITIGFITGIIIGQKKENK